MAKIVSKVFQARMDMAKRLGRSVSISEVAQETNLSRNAIARLEEGDTRRFDGPMMAKLCEFYGVDIGDLLTCDFNQEYESESPIMGALHLQYT